MLKVKFSPTLLITVHLGDSEEGGGSFDRYFTLH